LGHYLRGMRYGLIVTLDLPVMREAINTLLDAVSSRESRANLVTLGQIFSTYQSHEVGAPIMKSTAPARMVEIFDGLIADPLYRDLSHHAANMGDATGSFESVAAVTRAAKRLTDKDNCLNFGQYDAFIASGRPQIGRNSLDKHFNSQYFPPIVPIGEAYDRARAAWRRDSPPFIPIGSYPGIIDLPPGTVLALDPTAGTAKMRKVK
jgi:hypothetical protein